MRAELTAHCGGNPSFPQAMLIERAAVLALRIAQIEAKMLAGEALTLHDNNHAIAWHNAYRRTLTAIGLEPAAAKAPTLADLFSDRVAKLTPEEAYRQMKDVTPPKLALGEVFER